MTLLDDICRAVQLLQLPCSSASPLALALALARLLVPFTRDIIFKTHLLPTCLPPPLL
jgi:hypothetical protein